MVLVKKNLGNQNLKKKMSLSKKIYIHRLDIYHITYMRCVIYLNTGVVC